MQKLRGQQTLNSPKDELKNKAQHFKHYLKRIFAVEELRLLAKNYYQNTVGLRFYGKKGWLYLLCSIPFMAACIYLVSEATQPADWKPMPLAFITAFIWIEAGKQYERNLIRHLTFFTHLESTNIHAHKAQYLQEITSHVGLTIFDSMKAFKDIIDTHKKNQHFLLINGWGHFFKFLYDPESKNRILSLVIYLISLIALLTIIKSETNIDIYYLISEVDFEQIKTLFFVSIIFILLCYVIVIVPILFIITYIIVPLLLRFSLATLLSTYFISQLNRYAFFDVRKQGSP